MPFSVYINKKAAKYLDEIDQKIKERIKEAMKFLQTNPVPIEGKEHTYRIRIGRYRVIYDVLWNEKTIWVLIVDRRGDETYKF
jgi:mRNA interferase RelE/StbE